MCYSINNKLQQPESAAGVLEYAMKHHRADLVCIWYALYTEPFHFIYSHR